MLAAAVALVLAASSAVADGIDLAPIAAAAAAGAANGGAAAPRYRALAAAVAKRDRPGLADDFAKVRRAAAESRGRLAADAALAAAVAACTDEGIGAALASEDAAACASAAPVASRAVRRRVDASIRSARRSWDAALVARDAGRPDLACAAAGRAAASLASASRTAAVQVPREDARAARWHVVLEHRGGALWGVTATAGPDPVVYVVGDHDGYDPQFLRGGAEGFVQVPVSGDGDLLWVTQVSGGGVWACGDGGRVLRYDPATGAVADVPTTTTGRLWGVWGASPDDVWIVGVGSPVKRVLQHWDGAAWEDWSARSAGNGLGLYKVWGRASDDVWACGAAGALLHWDGAAWTTVETGIQSELLTVHGRGDDVTAVGATVGATILERDYDGTFVSQPLVDRPASAAGIFLPARGVPWSVGYRATIQRKVRGRWRAVTGAPDVGTLDLHSVWIDDTGAAWIAGGDLQMGREGLLLHFGPRTPSSDVLPQARLADRVQPVLAAECAHCHAGPVAPEALDFSDAAATAAGLRRRSAQAPLLRALPGRPSASYLWRKLDGSHLAAGGRGDTMPQGHDDALPQADLDAFRAWILEGAPAAE